MIFVTTGTHHQPFLRLIRAARALEGEPVEIQDEGSVLEPAAWRDRVRAARVVVCHAGPATIEAVVASGKIPIVVPRRRLWLEHVDDHQLRYAERIAHKVHVLFDPAELAAAISCHDAVVAGLISPWVCGVNPEWIRSLCRSA